MQVWDLFENDHIFRGRDQSKSEYDEAHHLAEMVALLGPPPLHFLQRSERSLQYWDENGWLLLLKPPDEAI